MSSNLLVTSLASGGIRTLPSCIPNFVPDSFSTGKQGNLEVTVSVNLLVHQIHFLSLQF